MASVNDPWRDSAHDALNHTRQRQIDREESESVNREAEFWRNVYFPQGDDLLARAREKHEREATDEAA